MSCAFQHFLKQVVAYGVPRLCMADVQGHQALLEGTQVINLFVSSKPPASLNIASPVQAGSYEVSSVCYVPASALCVLRVLWGPPPEERWQLHDKGATTQVCNPTGAERRKEGKERKGGKEERRRDRGREGEECGSAWHQSMHMSCCRRRRILLDLRAAADALKQRKRHPSCLHQYCFHGMPISIAPTKVPCMYGRTERTLQPSLDLS